MYDIHHVPNKTNSTTDQMFTHQPKYLHVFDSVQRYRSQFSSMRNVDSCEHPYTLVWKTIWKQTATAQASCPFIRKANELHTNLKCLDHFGCLFSADKKTKHTKEFTFFCWCHVIRDEYASDYEINDDSVERKGKKSSEPNSIALTEIEWIVEKKNKQQ